MTSADTGIPAADPTPQAATQDGAAPGADEAQRIAALVAALQAENAELKDKSLRLLADMDNLRRRTEREVQDARTYGVSKFALDMLSVADNLRRALEAMPAAEAEAAGEATRTLMEGVSLTERELLKTLERHGVKKREPVGERFDPHKDQAMFEVPDESKPSGTVVQIVQAGYTIGDRVLRPTLVGVSKSNQPAGTLIDKGA